MDVSIILVNYNTFSLVVECIKSIHEKTIGCTYEIIVVDNLSPKRDIENLNSIFPDVKLILNSQNAGFGAGNNLGVENAVGKYLFFLNSDTLLLNDAVSILSEFLERNALTAVVGANLFDDSEQPATSFAVQSPSLLADIDYFFFNVFSKAAFRNNVFFNHGGEPLELQGSVSGASYMIRRNIFTALGGFDEDFFMYYEETELSFRVKKAGFKLMNVPEAKIIHLEGSSENIQERKLNWTLESKKKYYEKTSNIFFYYISNFIWLFIILQRLLIFTVLGNAEKRKFWKTLLSWYIRKLKI